MKAVETEKGAADERISELQAKIVDEISEGADGGAGGSEALQKELSLTLMDLAKASTEVYIRLGGLHAVAVGGTAVFAHPHSASVQSPRHVLFYDSGMSGNVSVLVAISRGPGNTRHVTFLQQR